MSDAWDTQPHPSGSAEGVRIGWKYGPGQPHVLGRAGGEGPAGVSVGRRAARPSLAGAGAEGRLRGGGKTVFWRSLTPWGRQAGEIGLCSVGAGGQGWWHWGWWLSCTCDGIPVQNCPAGWNGGACPARVSLDLSVLPSLGAVGVHLSFIISNF